MTQTLLIAIAVAISHKVTIHHPCGVKLSSKIIDSLVWFQLFTIFLLYVFPHNASNNTCKVGKNVRHAWSPITVTWSSSEESLGIPWFWSRHGQSSLVEALTVRHHTPWWVVRLNYQILHIHPDSRQSDMLRHIEGREKVYRWLSN